MKAPIAERVRDMAADRLAEFLDDDLVPDSVCKAACGGVTDMTWWRWERDPKLGMPVARVIRRRKYRRAVEIRAFRKRVFGF